MQDSLFKVSYGKISPGRRLISHHTLMFICQGGFEIYLNGESYALENPSIVILSPMDSFQLKNNFNSKVAVPDAYEVEYDVNWIERVSDDGTNLMECFHHKQISHIPYILLNESQYSNACADFDRLMKLSQMDGHIYGALLECKLLSAEMLINTNRVYRKSNNFTMSNSSLVVNDSVQRVLDYIRENYWDDISIEMLSVMFKINRNQLCKLFKDLTGTSPIRYLIEYRLSTACSFLEQGFSVEETCSKVGFSNLPHFSKSFKQRFGVSPKQYGKLKAKS